jgi:tetratricopeptide (TPR) repeat protein
VALKIMAGYLSGTQFVRRFEVERQLLASLNHHHITRLLDGGVSSAGDPYLITEYVEGEAINGYCDRLRLDVKARLRLFLQVCEAVDHAHRNLIVHRDLKPDNILVNREGQVKLLDFGTASLASAPSDTTRSRIHIMTPRYASPEQLRGERVGIPSDIYSLGVVLYELATGAWPYGDPESVLSGLNRAVGDRPPARPTAVVSAQSALYRSTHAEQLRRQLRGDISAILLKALEDRPAGRYDSVREFAADLEHYLDGRPIAARPHTMIYRSRKFVRRHWLPVTAAAILAVVLPAATVIAMVQARAAKKQAARAERIAAFAKDTFLSASSYWRSPLGGKSNAIQFSDILDNAADRVGKELGQDPEAEAELRATLGATYGMLGDPAKGEVQLRLALERLKHVPGGAPRRAADIHVTLCDTLSFEGRYGEAVVECRESLALARMYGAELGLGGIMHDTAFMTVKSGGRLEDAEKMYTEALHAGPGSGGSKVYGALINTRIGDLRQRLGDLTEGGRILSEAEQVFRGEPGPPIEIVPVLTALAAGCRMRGDYQAASRYLHEALDLLTQRPTFFLGRDQIEMDLAAVEALRNDPPASRRWKESWARLQSTTLAPAEKVHFGMISGMVEARMGVLDSAERDFRKAIELSEKELPQQPADRVEIYVRLAEMLSAAGKSQSAGDVARQGLHTAESAYGKFFAGHPFVATLHKIAN